MTRTDDDADVASERDFYRRLLELSNRDEVGPLLDDALSLIVEVTGARVAYVELYDRAAEEPLFWKGHGCSADDVDQIRRSISRGIIAQTLKDGLTVETPSALDDARFQDLGSVRRNDIEAVLCAPVGREPPVGVVYLQGRARPGSFSARDRERAELFARQLAPLADRLVAPFRVDYTRSIRDHFPCPGLIGRSAAFALLLRNAWKAAPFDIHLLITGEHGTGKSVLARAVHDHSRRASGPFVAVNCAAIPDTLVESELFGAERGSHSQATKAMKGKVAAAERGTLFLDEIAELSLNAQAKILHLLQERTYHPLGATEPVEANVRIISATNADLVKAMEERRFREDLYYRLNVVPLRVPGVSERRDDIPELVGYFCADASRRHQVEPMELDPSTIAACRDASWPGHVRELANAIERGVINAASEGGQTVQYEHVFGDRKVAATGSSEALRLHDATRQFQARFVKEALERNQWNVVKTASELGIARSHVYNRIDDFGLERPLEDP